MAEREFQIGERKFKLNKIDAMKQFHIVRRIAPILQELVPAMGTIAKSKVEDLSEEDKLAEFSKIVGPVMNGLARLSDDDSNFVLYRLLSSVEILQPQFNSWTYIATEAGIKMQDLELPEILQIAGKAFMYNLSNFFSSLPRKA